MEDAARRTNNQWDDEAPHDRQLHKSKGFLSLPLKGNPGLRLLDACVDDVAYARFLLQSKSPADRLLRSKVNWKDPQGVSILHCLAYGDLEAPMKLLIEHNADVNIRNKHNETPLHWAAKMNSMKAAKLLIDSMANVNATDYGGSTALHCAVGLQHMEMVVLLLERGADALIGDSEHVTPIELLAESKTTAARAIMIVFLRHYQKKGLAVPKNVSDKIGFVPTPGDHIGAIIQRKYLQTVSAASPTRSSVATHRPFSSSKAASSATTSGDPVEDQVAAQILYLQSQLEAVGTGQTKAPLTLYDQLRQQQLLQQQQQQQAAISPPPVSGPTRRGSFFSGGGESAGGKLRRRQSFLTHSSTGSSGPTPLATPSSAATHAHSSGNINGSSKVGGAGAGAALGILGVLEENRQLNAQKERKASPSSPSATKRPTFAVRKLDEDGRAGSHSSLAALLRNLDSPGPSSPDKRLSRKSSKIAQSMSAVPALPVTLEEFLSTTMAAQALPEAEQPRPETEADAEADERPRVSEESLRRRHASAPEIIVPTEVQQIGLEPAHEVREEKSSGTERADDHPAHSLSIVTKSTTLPPTPTLPGPGQVLAPLLSLPDFVEMAYPPAEVIPFLPTPSPALGDLSPGHLDVVLAVEHCCDCHLHNDQSLRHNVQKYVSTANAILYSLIRALAQSKLAVRLFALRSRPLTPQRLGALEVTIAVRVDLPDLVTEAPVVSALLPASANGNGPQPQQPGHAHGHAQKGRAEAVVTMQQQRGAVKWATHRLFSKLETKSWPNFRAIETKAVQFLEVVAKDVLFGRKVLSTPFPRPLAASSASFSAPKTGTAPAAYDVYHDFKYADTPYEIARDVHAQYNAWIERMKIPPQVVRDPLDMDWPAEIIALDRSAPPGQLADYLQKHPHLRPQHPAEQQLRHPAGPYIDISLLGQNSKEEFERAVLEHFLVFDARFCKFRPADQPPADSRPLSSRNPRDRP